jgi:hypothetical protein
MVYLIVIIYTNSVTFLNCEAASSAVKYICDSASCVFLNCGDVNSVVCLKL